MFNEFKIFRIYIFIIYLVYFFIFIISITIYIIKVRFKQKDSIVFFKAKITIISAIYSKIYRLIPFLVNDLIYIKYI